MHTTIQYALFLAGTVAFIIGSVLWLISLLLRNSDRVNSVNIVASILFIIEASLH